MLEMFFCDSEAQKKQLGVFKPSTPATSSRFFFEAAGNGVKLERLSPQEVKQMEPEALERVDL